jgi:hypothetical protein
MQVILFWRLAGIEVFCQHDVGTEASGMTQFSVLRVRYDF